jgi:probable rRNA maturation factor
MSENCLVRIMAPSSLWEANQPKVPEFATDVVKRAVEASGRVHSDSEVSLVLSDDRELRLLNAEHRGIDKPTNVLAFPGEPLDEDGAAYTVRQRPLILGDIVIAYERVAEEAEEQGKTFDHHFAHLLVHGTLHLCRYDHEKEADAEKMENLERRILKAIGIGDPYAELPPRAEQAAALPRAPERPVRPAKAAPKKAAAKRSAPKRAAPKKAVAKKKPAPKRAAAKKPATKKAAPKKKAPARKAKPARRTSKR